MKSRKVFIVEDELHIQRALIQLLQDEHPQLEIVGTAESKEKAIPLIQELQPDLLFLDVQLPDGTGFDIMNEVDLKKLKIIFITAYSEYAIKAIKLSAVDYLLKPFLPDELTEAIQKAEKIIELESVSKSNSSGKKVFIKTKMESFYVELDNIIYLKADGNYTHIFLLEGNKDILIAKTLKYFEDTLPEDCFLRVHQSYLVNTKHIKKLQGYRLSMLNEHSVEISRRKKPIIMNILQRH
ncbi:MAG: response regulator transcription factor [Crocinitomicaceae bacterium]|nr:response regulator transcription factor [Crocinitomicaceae bacterium]